MSRRILAVHFVESANTAVVLFDDCKFARMVGPVVKKWQSAIEAMVETERVKTFQPKARAK